jgi:hypothetical protein
MMKTADARQGPKLGWFGRAWLNRPARVYLMMRYGMKYADNGAAFYRISTGNGRSRSSSPKPKSSDTESPQYRSRPNKQQFLAS